MFPWILALFYGLGRGEGGKASGMYGIEFAFPLGFAGGEFGD